MFSNKYERIIMITIIVGVVGLLGFSEYYIYKQDHKKSEKKTQLTSKQDLETVQNVKVSSSISEDLEMMIKSAGRDHVQLLIRKTIDEDGSEEAKRGEEIEFGSKDKTLTEKMESWLQKEAYKYGFVKRYKNNHTTYYYAGRKLAETIYEKGVSFEEYLTK